LTDAADAAYVQNKGWQGVGDLYKSYRAAEKMIGRDPNSLLVMPRADDPTGFRETMTKLGMPAEAAKYDFGKFPEGFTPDEKVIGWAKEAFHAAGLTNKQAQDVIAANVRFTAERNAAQEQEYNIRVTADKQNLQREWGGGFERMMNSAKVAARSLGLTGEDVDALEQARGYAGTMKFLAELGKKLSEDTFHTGDRDNGGQRFSDTMTPQEATVEWEKMKMDPNTQKALFDTSHPGHKETKAKQAKLFAIMYPG